VKNIHRPEVNINRFRGMITDYLTISADYLFAGYGS